MIEDIYMQLSNVIERTEHYVRETLFNESTGHDWWHIKRVYNLALHIAGEEKKSGGQIDSVVVQLAVLLHDIADWKFQNGNDLIGSQKAREWLMSVNTDENTVSHVCQIIEKISFKGAGVSDNMPTIEGAIVQDADRLDALGAIGIARCFAAGVKLGNAIHDPDTSPTIHKTVEDYKKFRSTSINHFYEKLFLLKDRMKTKAGRSLAEERHHYMEKFIERFFSEWVGRI